MTDESNRQGVAILGSTGSIGTTALRVLSRHPDRFRVAALTAFSNALLIKDYGRAETMLAPWLRSQLPPGGLKHVMRETLGDAPPAAEFSISPLTYDNPASMRESGSRKRRTRSRAQAE